MTDKGLLVRLSARHFNFRADSEAEFLAGCYGGLRMLLTDKEQAQGLQAAGLPAMTSHRAETRGAEAPEVEGVVHTPR